MDIDQFGDAGVSCDLAAAVRGNRTPARGAGRRPGPVRGPRAQCDDFRFTAKGHRYITHSKMLNDARESVVRSRDNIEPLGSRLEVVVWQLPVRLSKNADRLRRFCDDLRAVWPGVRHTIEFRHASWFDDEIAEIVGDADVAVCQSDAADWPIWEAVTAGFVYLRLHGHTRTYRSRYSADLLGKWADRIAGWLEEGRDVYAFFDNDVEGAAPRDALRLKERLEARE